MTAFPCKQINFLLVFLVLLSVDAITLSSCAAPRAAHGGPVAAAPKETSSLPLERERSTPNALPPAEVQSELNESVETPSDAWVYVRFNVIPTDSEITIDGKPYCEGRPPSDGSCTKHLKRGNYHIVISRANYPTKDMKDEPVAENRFIDVNLEKLFGYVDIVSSEKYTMRDGDQTFDGGPNATRHKLFPGGHRLHFTTKHCKRDWETDVNVMEGKVVSPVVKIPWEMPQGTKLTILPGIIVGGHLNEEIADVFVDGRKRLESKTATYEIPCDAQSLEVRYHGKQAEKIDVDTQKWNDVFEQKVWRPRLQQTELRGWHVDCHEVTVRQFKEFLRSSGLSLEEARALQPRSGETEAQNWERTDRQDHPVNSVTFAAASRFCSWRAASLGKAEKGHVADEHELRLAVGYHSNEFIYPWGSTPDPNCDRVVMKEKEGFDGCSNRGEPHQDATHKGTTLPVCSKQRGRSQYGHCDILGNVSEWVGRDAVFGGGFRDGLTRLGKKVFSVETGPLPPRSHPVSDNVGFRCAWKIPDGKQCSCWEDIEHSIH